MDPQKSRRIVAVAVVAVGLAAIGGIVAVSVADRGSSDNANGDPVAALRAAPAKIQGKRLRGKVTIGTGGLLQVQASQTGVFDSKAGRADVVLDGLPSGPIRLVLDGSTLYARPSQPIQGKPWGRIDTGDAAALGSGPGAVSATQIDTLVGLLGTVTAAQDKGTETIDGMELRHYTTSVDPSAVAGASEIFARVGGTAPVVEVHLDDEGAPRRLSVTSESAGTKVAIGVQILEIGVDGEITLPPAGEVAPAELRDLLGGTRG